MTGTSSATDPTVRSRTIAEPAPVHPIEAESFRILSSRIDLGHFGPLTRHVVARAIHASADLEFGSTMVAEEEDVAAGIDAIRSGNPVVCDVEMVRAGIPGTISSCFLEQARRRASVRDTRLTLSADAMRIAAETHPKGAIVVVGCAPTALFEVVRLAETGDFNPALVIGMPVGFVGAAESKSALRSSGLACISNAGEKGGSAAAAAVFNALSKLAGVP